ncbi:YhcH/YjgK/YiaL family protein [Mycoplasmopsis gallopavonis]|uniref:Beta-galactosidase-like protein n=1 Tax=Mycoplasmopsis gallopavonis TaxID=76629 RepID=A0A449AZZ1_9BACT|nr:YhcH/YjgK/YiaL family protein [Mycoplasmopsis gallopavonis]RIV16469.1 DUF386 family protein [Mycoplasmopsis gallopavonis]VEU73088.1 beta-galactosidase-like protein [Mycoplasmopsis gallopavonis]
MIFDSLKNIDKYQTKYPEVNHALSLLKEIKFDELKLGPNIINEAIKVVKLDFQDAYPELKFGEVHEKFVDIHVYGGTCDEIIYYDEDLHFTKDDILLEDLTYDLYLVKVKEYTNKIILKPNTFALFFPGEFHAPKISNQKFTKINKYVVKIKVN